jgi:hypothetical protein
VLGVNAYPRQYVDGVRAKLDAQVSFYKDVAKAAGKATKALDAFEPVFFNNLVVVLEMAFVHRLRTKEGKDGNALNEVRLLTTSLLSNDGRLVADKQIKLKPESSVLGLSVGDEIRLNDKDFGALSDAFFAELEKRFV